MLLLYVLTVDIMTDTQLISYEQFQEQVASCLTCLESLKGAFDQSPCSITFYPPDVQQSNTEFDGLSARGVVMISIGKKRAEHLMQLYQAIVRLIEFELPLFDVKAETGVFQFS